MNEDKVLVKNDKTDLSNWSYQIFLKMTRFGRLKASLSNSTKNEK